MLISIISTLLAAATVTVYNPRVPVIVDREFNVVSEIVIPSESARDASGEVVVSLDGIPLKAIKDVRLVYIGTISPVMSRTKSNVMKSHYNYWGAGQEDWYAPRSVFIESKVKPKSNTVKLAFDRPLVKGENHFYVSLNINSAKIGLADTFSCKVDRISLDGGETAIIEHGPSWGRRYGVALRNHGDDGVDTYRIPGLAKTKKGDLIAVYDIRWNTYFDLQADIDVGFQKSSDGGKTWSKMGIAMDMGEYGGLPKDQNGTGDPCVLVDENTGDIYVFAIWAHGLEGSYSIFTSKEGFDPIDVAQIAMVKSSDEGKTWSKPVSITPMVKQPGSATLFQGPGCGITMSDGTLVVPIQEWDKDKVPSAGIIYSKDHGKTWQVSNMAVDHVCEDQVVEIKPGVLMLNMRNNGTKDRTRKVFVTSDLGKTWTAHVSNDVLPEPVCQASILKAGNTLLFANPDSKVTRNMFTIKASDDLGETWPHALLLDEEGGWGYSCMAMIDDETVGIVYEGSQSHIVYQAVKLEDILSTSVPVSEPVIEKPVAKRDPVMLLRLRMPNTATEEAWNDLLAGIKANPDCCDEIWFSTGVSDIPLEAHRAHVEKLLRAKEDLSELGIGTSVQVQMTIGHGDSIGETEDFSAKTWTGWTGSTGVEAKFCNCPRQPEFLEYMRKMAGLYAQVKPRVMWVDDDLRYDNHYPATANSRIGCWCEKCLADFSEQEGKVWTRKSLDKAMAKDKALEERWKEFSISSLDRIARIIAEETKAVSPETKMGYQKTYADRDTTVVRTILRTMAEVSGKKVEYRPGGGSYYDKLEPSRQIMKSMTAARYMRVLGCSDIVDSWCPEVETHPRHYGSRTGQAVLLEGFTALAYGLDAVSMFVLDNGEESMDVHSRRMLRPLHEGAPVLHEYAKANKGTVPVGFTADVSSDVLFPFGLLGIPVIPGLGESLGALSGEDLKGVDTYSETSSAVQAFRDKIQGRSKYPAKCVSPFIGLVIPRASNDGTIRTLGLINCRIDSQEAIRFSLPGLPADIKTATWREMRKGAVTLTIGRDSDGEAYVEVPAIGAWNAGFIDF